MKYILINTLEAGGAERQISVIASHMKIDAIFLLNDRCFYPIENLRIEALSHCINVFLSRLIAFASLLKKVKSGDTVISFLQQSNYFNIALKLCIGHRAIIAERTTPSRVFCNGLRRLHLFLIAILYPHASLIIANSEGVKNDLIENFSLQPSSIEVIINAFNVEAIEAIASEEINKSAYGEKFIVSVGRIDDSKAFWHIIRVFSRVKRSFPGYKLAIIGDGKYRSKLMRYCSELGLKIWHQFQNEYLKSVEDPDVYFLGIQHNPFQYMARAKLFILSSLYEGFPNVLVEAMACGTPVMSSDCRSGPREILAPDTDFRYETKMPEYAKYGILMPVFDGAWRGADEPLTHEEQVWADEIVKVLSNEELLKRYEEVGKSRAQDFSIEKIIPQWERVIQENCPELSSRV